MIILRIRSACRMVLQVGSVVQILRLLSSKIVPPRLNSSDIHAAGNARILTVSARSEFSAEWHREDPVIAGPILESPITVRAQNGVPDLLAAILLLPKIMESV